MQIIFCKMQRKNVKKLKIVFSEFFAKILIMVTKWANVTFFILFSVRWYADGTSRARVGKVFNGIPAVSPRIFAIFPTYKKRLSVLFTF